MNLKDALNSGKKFKRKSRTTWWELDPDILFNLDEVLADDWEIQKDRITIEKQDLDKVWDDTVAMQFKDKETSNLLRDLLAKKLGL